MENETKTISQVSDQHRVRELETELRKTKDRNSFLGESLKLLEKRAQTTTDYLKEIFDPVIDTFGFIEEYEVRDIAEEAAREAVDDFEIDNHMDAIRRDVLDNIDLNDYAETIRDICGLNDPEDLDAPNPLDNIRDIIREELSGAYIQGQIKLSDE
tara:strand:+ start:473 stop:940 length:468 start_codon:yes stop_codon:yes gene_type:complete